MGVDGWSEIVVEINVTTEKKERGSFYLGNLVLQFLDLII